MFDRIIKMFIAASLVVVPLAGAAKDYVVKSPSGNLVLKVATVLFSLLWISSII